LVVHLHPQSSSNFQRPNHTEHGGIDEIHLFCKYLQLLGQFSFAQIILQIMILTSNRQRVHFHFPFRFRTIAMAANSSSSSFPANASLPVDEPVTRSTVSGNVDAEFASEKEPGVKSEAASDVMSEVESEAESKHEGPRFTCFPKLPPELRNKIWKGACSVPRIIDLWAVPIFGKTGEEFFSENFSRIGPIAYKSHSRQPPAILHTSREARTLGLECYSLEFGDEIKESINGVEVKMSIPAKIYINWKCDIICPMPAIYSAPDDDYGVVYYDISSPCILQFADRASNVRCLALEVTKTDWIDYFLELAHLKEIFLYHHPEDLEGVFNEAVSFDLIDVGERVDEQIARGGVVRSEIADLHNSKARIEESFRRRQSADAYEAYGELPVGWILPTVKLMEMNVYDV